MKAAMRTVIGILAALVCVSCGGGSSGSVADPAASASAAPTSPTSTSDPSADSSSTATSTSSAPSAGTPFYNVVEIPRLAATGSVTANALNDQGMVVGAQETTAAPRAWMYEQSSGALNELTLDPTEDGAYANGISNSGVIAGAEVPAGGAPLPGFWTATGGAMLLTGNYQSFAQAVAADDDGTIIGNYGQSGTVSSVPLVWTVPGYAQTTLPGLQCEQCARLDVTASSINDGALIVGSSTYSTGSSTSTASGMHAVEWQNGAITDLGALQGAEYSAAYSINDSGDVVGGSRTGQASGAPTHAFLYQQGAMTDLGTLSGDSSSSANSINDSGQIVGVSQSDTATRAFLYENGRMYDLNTLIDTASPLAGVVSLQQAVGISANGWIAVNGTDSRDPGWTRAFLLIPVQ
jgi:probable HAF family extracellular repeat protein